MTVRSSPGTDGPLAPRVRQRQEAVAAWCLALPATLLLLLFLLGPAVAVVLLSLTDWQFGAPSLSFVGLGNFEAMAASRVFWRSLVSLDTNEPDSSWGVLCERRLDWLEARLAARPRESATLFLHHPPFAVGIRAMDRIALRETGRFERILASHPGGIRHLFFGHLHRPVSGSWCGIPFSTLRATNHQVWLDLETDGQVPGSHEPPQYAVVLIDDRLTVVHLHDFLDDTHGFFL